MFTDFFHSFYYSILFLGAFIGALLIRRLNAPFKWIALLLIATLASELIAKYFSSVLRITNSPVYHFFTVIEFVIYTVIFAHFTKKSKWTKYLFNIVLLFALAEIINTYFLQPLKNTNTNILILESLILIFYSLVLFLSIRENTTYANIFKEGIFWFNCGILIYYCFSILIWGFHSIKVYEMQNPPRIIYSILLLVNGLMYLIFIFSIVLDYKSRIGKKKSI